MVTHPLPTETEVIRRALNDQLKGETFRHWYVGHRKKGFYVTVKGDPVIEALTAGEAIAFVCGAAAVHEAISAAEGN